MKETKATELDVMKNPHSSRMTIIVLLVIVLLISVAQAVYLFYLTGGKTVQENILAHEYAKVGGKANYETITDLQKEILTNPASGQDISTQKEFLKQLKAANQQGTTATNNTVENTTDSTVDANSTVTFDTLSEEKRNSILEKAVIEGNKDAEIIVVEYSDMECPYCVRQVNDTEIVKNLREEFGDKVANVFKNHRGVNHKGTEKKGLGLLCANVVGGNEMYTKFYTAIFDFSRENEGYYPVTKLADLAAEIGLDVEKWKSCLENPEMLAQFDAETQEAVDFGLSGTPGTLIFNTKTGKYTTVSGAHPYPEFQKAVNSLLAE